MSAEQQATIQLMQAKLDEYGQKLSSFPQQLAMLNDTLQRADTDTYNRLDARLQVLENRRGWQEESGLKK
eukprot:3011904-Karenia_brevis.AAC.1